MEETVANVSCPKCGSTQITGGTKGFGAGKAVAGALVAGPLGLAAGAIGKNQIRISCMACGVQWKPAEREQLVKAFATVAEADRKRAAKQEQYYAERQAAKEAKKQRKSRLTAQRSKRVAKAAKNSKADSAKEQRKILLEAKTRQAQANREDRVGRPIYYLLLFFCVPLAGLATFFIMGIGWAVLATIVAYLVAEMILTS